MVLGEGSYLFVLEALDRALARGANIYAEIAGYGSTCDAYHRVRLAEDGDEPARAMTLALEDAGCEPKDLDYVNLHGTSTLLNDRVVEPPTRCSSNQSRYSCRARFSHLLRGLRWGRSRDHNQGQTHRG